MKTFSYVVILLLCYVFPADAQQVASDCSTPPSTFRHTWYFDPVNGQTEAAMTAAGVKPITIPRMIVAAAHAAIGAR